MLAGTLAYLLLAFSVIREEHLELIEPERVPEMRSISSKCSSRITEKASRRYASVPANI
jgi:hypothetical protein